MANWQKLKGAIADVIKTNENQEITGAVLQSTFMSTVNSLGENATFAGIAIPSTNPGIPDGPVFYIAATPGQYVNFAGVEVGRGELAIFYQEDENWVAAVLQPTVLKTSSGSIYTADAGNSVAESAQFATVLGASNYVEGNHAFATGFGTQAIGENSHAEGTSTIASGTESHAEGDQCQALGDSSHAEGDETIANGKQAHAEGHLTQAIGSSSHAEGKETKTTGAHSHAEGYSTVAEGEDSHAEGHETKAKGFASHVEGKSNGALGAYSHVEGEDNIAGNLENEQIGTCAHAEGHQTKAVGNYAHSEGDETAALGTASHAEGNNTEARGTYSHAEGHHTITTNKGEHACGRYNVSNTGELDADKTIFSVGIGTNSRKNGLEVRENGDIYLWLNNSYICLQDILDRIGGTYATAIAEEELNTIVDDYLDKVE